ncbi:hypothetical protein [Altererythrobacter sp. Root672]|uniref:hypothetical protein n=1 Tax=Altererythrobacter sp. Root672 TaxID=1736584 RepID=UPI0006FD16F7|nr:hypothetical protein [Altererythrobacter sp. Root672]KRA83363.1 hypothetical protein ASD76_04730 [Altererythrobacter sp. Root672]
MKRIVLCALGALAAGVVANPAYAQAGCTRERLVEVAEQYRAAQASGQAIMHMRPMGEWVNYNENFELSSMTYGGVIATPQKVDWDRAFYDTTSCSVYVESIITNPEHPYVLATIVNSRGGTINGFDVIVADQDDWLFNAEKTLYYAQREDWSEIPEARRNTREEIKAAADAYLDLFKDKTAQVPWGTPCARLEGSVYTGKGTAEDTCNVGVPENIDMTERRYVIDPAYGAVAVFLKMGPNKRPDAHVFRIEDGKIRFIHTITNCKGDNNCGFTPFAEMVKRNPNMWPNLDHLPVVKPK